MDPSDHDKRDLDNSAPDGGHGPTHADGGLSESDGWLRSVVENSSEIIKVMDADGTLRYASPAFGKILGYGPEEMVGEMNVLDHVHPDDLPRVLEQTEKALAEGKTVSNRAEYRFRHKDGSWRWVEGFGTYLLDDPVVRGVVVSARDITGRKEAEGRFRLQAQLLEAVGEAVIALDADGRVVFWNRAAEEMYGWSSDEAMGRRLGEWVVPGDLRPHAGENLMGVRAGLGWKGEFVVRRKDGSRFPVEATNTPVFGQDGEQVGIVSVLKDITERREAEEALRHSEAELFSVLESFTDGFFALDEEWRYTYINRQAEAMLGQARESLIGERMQDDRNFYPYYRRAVAERTTVTFEAFYPGSESWYSVRAYPSASGLSVYLQDVTERRKTEKALRETEKRYRTLVEQIPAITYIDRADGSFRGVYTSPQIEGMLGYTPEEWLEGKLWEKRLHPDDRARIMAADEVLEIRGEPFAEEYRLLAKDGSVVWVREEAVLVRDEEGEPTLWQGIIHDVTESKEAEARLRESEERFRGTFEDAGIGMALSSPDGRYLRANRSFCELLGYPEEELLGMTFRDVTHPDDLEKDLELGHRMLAGEARTFSLEKRYVRKDGSPVWVDLTVSMLRGLSGESLYSVSQAQDITGRKALEERLVRQALHDPLTGLPNRRLLTDRLAQALTDTGRQGRAVAVLFMDLDDFKVVNDSLGHDAGDLLLAMVAQRLGRCLGPEDTLARFGGDEFVVLLEAIEDSARAVRVAERIMDELRKPFSLEGRELYVFASVGISSGTAFTKSPDDLLRDADTAMYRAKEGGGGFRVFHPAMHERVARRLDLENDLRRAVERGEFVLHYQPIFDFGERRVWGTEALLRWDHPERGLLGPDQFVAVAEETGLIIPIGGWALEEACRRTKEWQDGHPQNPPLGVIVNLSAKQLRHPGCEAAIRASLEKSGLPPGSLSLDVTETAFIDALEYKGSALERIRALGVRISIDDFGMGYSSLSYLKRLPADALKIDRSFLSGFGEDSKDTALVQMVIEIGHTLGMEVVAEGVEERSQAALLAETGCDKAQGYHFSRPLPFERVSEFLGEG